MALQKLLGRAVIPTSVNEYGAEPPVPNCSVIVRNATKDYSKNTKGEAASGTSSIIKGMNDVNLTVETGSVFGLLGASGSGKTTLLECVVGNKRLDKGDIWVLGKHIKKRSDVSGYRIGYMPQQIALFNNFQIREIVYYFSWMYGMSQSEIKARFNFLSTMLEVPDHKILIKTLSGGQKRRVSLCVALMPDAELLILDEPTVGVDSILRRTVWNFLVDLVAGGKKTVIITTHYVNEARAAKRVGLMRNGVMLAENTPEKMMSLNDCATLEEVFFKLAKQRDVEPLESESKTTIKIKTVETKKSVKSIPSGSHFDKKKDADKKMDTNTKKQPEPSSSKDKKVDETKSRTKAITLPVPIAPDTHSFERKDRRLGRVKALLFKNFILIFRNRIILLFIFIFPAIQIILFYFGVGRAPHSLVLSVADEERNYSSTLKTICPAKPRLDIIDSTMEEGKLECSCIFFQEIRPYILSLNFYPTLSEAQDSVHDGKSWGAVHIRANFSKLIISRFMKISNKMSFEKGELSNSDVNVWLDMSSNYLLPPDNIHEST